jgi:hypothetical protein
VRLKKAELVDLVVGMKGSSCQSGGFSYWRTQARISDVNGTCWGRVVGVYSHTQTSGK